MYTDDIRERRAYDKDGNLERSMRMRKSILILVVILDACIILLFRYHCSPGIAPNRESFMHLYGGPKIDRGVAVRQAPDGGYIAVGYSTGFNEKADEDIYLLRTDAEGVEVWSRTYGGDGRDDGWDVLPLEDGGFLAAGFSDSFGEGDFDLYVVRTDKTGNLLWEKTYGTEGDEYGWALAKARDGGFVLAGETGARGTYREGDRDFYAVKIDLSGHEIWAKSYGGEKTDRCFAVRATPEGGFVLAGASSSTGAGDWDACLIKIDTLGNEEWSNTYGTGAFDMGHDVILCPDGGFTLIGYSEGYGAKGNDVWMVKTDSSGEVEWMKTIGEAGDDRAVRGVRTPDGGYALLGYTQSFGNGDWDVYMVRTDESGEVLWTRSYGGPGQDSGYGIQSTREGGFILTGWTNGFSAGEYDLLLVKTDRNGLVRNGILD